MPKTDGAWTWVYLDADPERSVVVGEYRTGDHAVTFITTRDAKRAREWAEIFAAGDIPPIPEVNDAS